MKCRYQYYLYSWYENGKLINTSNPALAKQHEKDPSFRAKIVPCGRCIACRISKAHDWAVRGILESYCHEKSSFITLTYDDEHLPKNLSVSKVEFDKFVKRLRENLSRKYPGVLVKVLGSGEYGDHSLRPHYHAIVYGFDFPDRQPLYRFKGNQYFTSPFLSELWEFGNHVIGEVNLTTITYCAKYVIKKVTGDRAAEHYGDRDPEFGYYPRRPALGREFFEKYTSDFFPKDFITIEGKKHPMPRYFYKRLEADFPELFNEVRFSRLVKHGDGELIDESTGEIIPLLPSVSEAHEELDHVDKYLQHMAQKVERQRSM